MKNKRVFKEGQYYVRKRDGLIYQAVPCTDHVISVFNGSCKDCKLKLMLRVDKDRTGFCCMDCLYTNYIRKLTKSELIIKDY